VSDNRGRSLLYTSLGHFFNDGSVVFVSVIVALLYATKGVTLVEGSVLFAIFYGSSAIASPYIGGKADRSGNAGPLIGAGIGLVSSGLLGFYVCTAYLSGIALLFASGVCMLAMGAGSAFYHPLGASVLQTVFQKSRGRALGMNGAAGSVARALYPTLFFGVAAFLSQPGSLGFFGLLGMGGAFAIWAGLKAVAFQGTDGRPPAKRAVSGPLLAVTALAFVRSFTVQSIGVWMPTYLANNRGLGVGIQLGLALTALYAAAIVGQPFFGSIADRFDHRAVLAFATSGAALSVIAFIFASGIMSYVLLAAFGFFTFNAFPLLFSLASDYSGGSASFGRGLVWGIGTTGGTALGPPMIVALILNDYTMFNFAFEVMAVVALVSAAFTMLLPGTRPG
jgi:MFS transporter, FSR family, fosmidomycin resistance protein